MQAEHLKTLGDSPAAITECMADIPERQMCLPGSISRVPWAPNCHSRRASHCQEGGGIAEGPAAPTCGRVEVVPGPVTYYSKFLPNPKFWHFYTSYSRSQRHRQAQTFEKLLLDSQQLCQVFSRFELSKSIVSDNSPKFVAEEFQQFCQVNGIRHVKVAPYHPSSNRLAEQAVQVFYSPRVLQVCQGHSIRSHFKVSVPVPAETPHSTTGVSPAELLMGRSLHSKLDLTHSAVTSYPCALLKFYGWYQLIHPSLQSQLLVQVCVHSACYWSLLCILDDLPFFPLNALRG